MISSDAALCVTWRMDTRTPNFLQENSITKMQMVGMMVWVKSIRILRKHSTTGSIIEPELEVIRGRYVEVVIRLT